MKLLGLMQNYKKLYQIHFLFVLLIEYEVIREILLQK